MSTKLGRIVTYLDGLLPIKSHDSFISTIRAFMAAKVRSMVTYPYGLLPIKSQYPLVT